MKQLLFYTKCLIPQLFHKEFKKQIITLDAVVSSSLRSTLNGYEAKKKIWPTYLTLSMHSFLMVGGLIKNIDSIDTRLVLLLIDTCVTRSILTFSFSLRSVHKLAHCWLHDGRGRGTPLGLILQR